MKLPILILLLFAPIFTANAQSSRVETTKDGRVETYFYRKGGDSLRFTIFGTNDTVQKAEFYRNGKPERASWKQDSVYEFNILGEMIEKHFGWRPNEPMYWDKSRMWDSTVAFYRNGGIKQIYSNRNNRRFERFFEANGALEGTEWTTHFPMQKFCETWTGKNVKVSTERIDTLERTSNSAVIIFDTLYFPNGKVYKTEARPSNQITFGAIYYKADGTVDYIKPADSLKLRTFKDNVDCFYGLVNGRGDTVVKAQFDRIDAVEDYAWAAHSGDLITLFDRKGAPIKPFAKQLTGFSKLDNFDFEKEDARKTTPTYEETFFKSIRPKKSFFAFQDADKYGVIDNKWTVVLPPQYFEMSNELIDNGRFIQYQKKQNETSTGVGYLDSNGNVLFNNRFKNVFYARLDGYFLLTNASIAINKYHELNSSLSYKNFASASLFGEGSIPLFGLGKANNAVLLPLQFHSIYQVHGSSLFITTMKKTDYITVDEDDEYRRVDNKYAQNTSNGIYDAQTRCWLLDSVGFSIISNFYEYDNYFIVKKQANNQYGLMSRKGQYILPIAYDSVAFSRDYDLFWLKKDGKYQIVTVKNEKATVNAPKYDFLSPLIYQTSDYYSLTIAYFLAKRGDKWGVVDAQNKIIKPFVYDYASADLDGKSFLLVKNNQAETYDFESLPNETPYFPHNKNGETGTAVQLGQYKIADKPKQLFFINAAGKVVIPPQYKRVGAKNYYGYEFVEDVRGNRKVIFTEQGAVVDFPFTYAVEKAEQNCRVMLVKDTAAVSFGVVSTSGRLLVPCVNYGVAIGDIPTATFFVKQDTPILEKREEESWMIPVDYANDDTLTADDVNWLMYDGDGKLLSDQPFRFPIAFEKGVGIGMKDDVFNLYTTDGAVLIPFHKKIAANAVYTEGASEFKNVGVASAKGYKNIVRDPQTGYYTLFYPQGRGFAMRVTDAKGQIIVETGRYTGMTKFYDKYAFVYADNKIGLIDTFGRERIAPQDLRRYAGHFIDSIEEYNFADREKTEKTDEDDRNFYDKQMYSSMSLYKNVANFSSNAKMSRFHKNALWNLIFERYPQIKMSDDFKIERAHIIADAQFLRKFGGYDSYDIATPRKISVSDSTIAFILSEDNYYTRKNAIFYNYYRRNGRWEDLRTNDLLDIQGENRRKMNDLITKKVKALRDQQIDCSNVAAFITTVENRWLLTKEGIDFCFNSSNSGIDFVIISFTWSELSPFLKLKIY